MELSPVQTLIEGLVDIVIENRIIIEGLMDKYLRKQQFDQNKINEDESIKPLDLVTEEAEQQQGVKNNVFNYYLQEHKQFLILQHPDYSINQIIARAAADFKNLDNASKVPYIRAYLKNHKHKTNSNHFPFDQEVRPNFSIITSSKNNQLSFNSYHSMNEQQYPHKINMNAVFRTNFQDQLNNSERFNDYRNSKEGNIGESTTGNRKERGDRDIQSRLRSDQKNGQKDKTNNNLLREDQKQKSEFQTLRSLFKKLQSNN